MTSSTSGRSAVNRYFKKGLQLSVNLKEDKDTSIPNGADRIQNFPLFIS